MESKTSVQIDHLNFTVTNLQQSIEWYRRLFGFEKVEEGLHKGEPWAILRSGDTLLCMYEKAQTPPLNENEEDWHKGPHKIWHFGLRVHDRDMWERTVEQNKIPVEYGGAVRYPHSLSWYIADPSGHEIEVSYWDNDTILF